MEKQRKSSLTSFNFQTAEDNTNEEGVLSKIFDKVFSAVSTQDSINTANSNNSNIHERENSIHSIILSKHTATSSSTTSSTKESSISNFPVSLLETTTPQSLTSTTATTTTTVTVGNQQRQKLDSNSSVQFIVPTISKSQDDPLEYLYSSPLSKRRSIDSDTQSVVTNFSISNTNSLGKILARLRGQKSDKEFWMPDEQCKECYKCRKPFTLLRRKHHCRTCGQIFCARCASHVISGKMFKQKGQVRVCNFCYAEQLQQLKESSTEYTTNTAPHKLEYSTSTSPLSKQSTITNDESLPSSETVVDQQNTSSSSFISSIIPSQKPPLAAPQMQIPTTGLKQAHSTYGNDDTPTFALEIPTNTSSPQPPITDHLDSPVIPAITTTGPTDGLKRLFDAGTSLLKRPRSNTSSSAPLFEYNPIQWDRGGGTVLAESELSPYPGNSSNMEDFFQDQLHHHHPYHHHHYSSSPVIPPTPPPPPPPPPMFHSKSSMLYQHLNPFTGSDDESYEVRMKRAEELRGTSEPSSLRRRSLTGSSSSSGNKRLKNINQQRIRTHGLPAAKASFEEWSPSPFLPEDNKTRLRLPPRQRRLSGPPQTVELSQSARAHARNMLRQLMQVVQLDNKEEWEQVMMNILLKVTTHVQPDIRAGDDMDVRHYVKIKKLPGGLPSDSFYVRGVACTKNVAHKRMVKNIPHPRILILLFSLDYSRVEMENQLLSIAPVISQEREHIKKLVGRIVVLKPSLLVVKTTVSRLALEFLLEANIPVIHNVKHSVIEAIARCTQASIVTSVDKLQHGLSFGRCGSFEIRTILHEWIPNRRKTYLIFDDCAPELGGTIVLRGERLEKLRIIKRLIDFMVFVVNNLKLETSLLMDSFAKNRGALDSTLSLVMNQSDIEDDEEQYVNSHYTNYLLKLYQNTILSVSQFVVYPPPYLLIALKQTEDKLTLLQQQRRRKSVSGSSIVTNATTVNITRDTIPTSASPTRSTFDRHVSDEVNADIEYDLVTKSHQLSRAWDAYIGENPEAISPFYHQNIVVLYSNVCTVTTVPCQGPEIRIFGFYRYPSDKTLGQYLIDLCTDARQPCPSFMCDYPMIQHYRSYANGNARINVMIEPFPCPLPGMSDKLLMWSYCKECNKPTPVLPMSENTWNYSFGKFLEIFLYQQGVHCRADICPHDMVRNHVRYFGYNDLAVRFQYEPIELLEVSPPPMRVYIHARLQMDLKDQVLKSIRSKINKFYRSIQERNKNFPFDLVDPRKLESCKAELQEMSLEAQGEKKDALQLVQNVYATSDTLDTLTIQVVYRNLFQVVQHWDAVYTDFVQYYLQPERELKKLTTTQLRKMFPADLTETSALDNIGNERTKRAAEVTDLPLVSIGLDGSDSESHEEQEAPLIMPVLSSSPSSLVQEATLVQYNDQKKSFLKPEIRRRLSLELMRELDEKAKYTVERRSSTLISLNRLNPNKFLRMKSPGALSATFTPSRIPIPRPQGESFQRSRFNSSASPAPPLDLSRLKGKQLEKRNTTTTPSSKPKKELRLRHYRHHSIGHSQQIQQRNVDDDEDIESESGHLYLRRSATTNKRFRSRLPRKKTYIQVYTQANDLVQEDIEDEFGGSGGTGHGSMGETRQYYHPAKPSNRKYSHTNDEDADNDMSDESSDEGPTIDYFSSFAPFASKVVGEGELPEILSLEKDKHLVKSPVSIPRSYSMSRPYFPFSDGFSSGMSGDDDCDLPSASDLLKIQQQQQLEEGNTSLTLTTLHNIHPDIIIDGVQGNGKLSETTSLEEIRHSAEKISFMKTLTNLLTDSGIGNLLPLESPLLPREYLFPDSYVVVKEDEPSTIIAYTLSSEDYIDKMHDIQDYSSDEGSNGGTVKQGDTSIKTPSEVTTLEPQNTDDIQGTLLKESGTHMRYNFSTGSTKFFCKIFFSEQFDALRRNCGCDESYIMSLASCIKWDSSGGKSGSAFLKTKDDRFLMKQMSKYELDAFLGFAPAYFQYMSEAFFSELPTVLAKILGFYSIGYKNSATGKSMRMDVLVMENLFYQRNVKKIFDLKGSMRNRHVQSTGKQDEVLLDENLVELIYQSPLFIRAHSKEILRSSLHNDTLFLSNRNVMDYSLLVGIDEERQELVVGIVDFIRTFTWDKKLESWVKETGILGGGGKEPTIVSPRQYRIRFREAMERYFLMVPDFWALTRQSRTSYAALHHDLMNSATDDE